jgi:uncharacterized membrane protein
MLKFREKNPLMKTERLLAFSDGVFAIAITLLILEIKIPRQEELISVGGLYSYLVKIWPSYLSYFVTFLVIGIYWSNHHWLFTFITKTNHVFNLLNILFLMAVCFLPFTSAILGAYVLDVNYENAAATTYCIGFLLMIVFKLVLYLYAIHKHKLIPDNLNKKFIRKVTYKLSVGILLLLAALLFSFYYPIISICIIGFSLIIYLLPPDAPVYDEENNESVKA